MDKHDFCNVYFGIILQQAITKGNIEGARIHAENAIRQKNQVSDESSFIPFE